MSAEVWAGTGDSTLPPTLTAALIRCFHIPHQLREESRVSIRACDWLRATFPSSHWSIVSQSAGAGDRNSSGSRALVPWPEPPTCSSVSTSPFPQLLRHNSQENNSQAEGSDRSGDWADSMKYLKQVRSKCGERLTVEMLFNISPWSSNTQLWCQCRVEIKSCGWLFYIWYLLELSEYFSFCEILVYILRQDNISRLPISVFSQRVFLKYSAHRCMTNQCKI